MVLSSEVVPQENVLVIAFSENQEEFPEPGDDGGGGTTPVYYEGLRVKRVKTNGITDGWLDGDLELRIKVVQSSVTIQGYLLSAFTFTSDKVDHDAGGWNWLFFWKESNKWTYINHYRKWSERQHVTILGVKFYNDSFTLSVWEEDVSVLTDDYIGDFSFNMDTHSFGSDILVSGGSDKCWVTLDSGSYAAGKYN